MLARRNLQIKLGKAGRVAQGVAHWLLLDKLLFKKDQRAGGGWEGGGAGSRTWLLGKQETDLKWSYNNKPKQQETEVQREQ